MMLLGIEFFVGFCYKHVVSLNFLNFFYLRGKSISIDFLYIATGRFVRFKTLARIDFLVCKKQCHFCALQLGVVTGKFGQRWLIRPIVLEVINVSSEVLFHYFIESFDLTICFGVLYSRQPDVDAQSFGQKLPENIDKLVTTIRYDRSGDAKKFSNMMDKKIR